MKLRLRTLLLLWPLAQGAVAPAVKPESAPAFQTIRAAGIVPAPPGVVWETLTMPAGLEPWFAAKASIELSLGGAVRVQMDPGESIEGASARTYRIVCFEPWRLLSLRLEARDTDPPAVQCYAAGVLNVHLTDRGSSGTKIEFAWTGRLSESERKAYGPSLAMIVRDKIDGVTAHLGSTPAREGPASRPGKQLTQVFTIGAPCAAVWKALTTKEEVERWMTPLAEIDLRVGGRFRTHPDRSARIGDPGTVTQTILTFEPERLIAFRTVEAPDAPEFVRVAQDAWTVVTLEPEGPNATRVVLAGVGYGSGADWDRAYTFFETANALTMRQLAEHFAPTQK